MLQDTQHVTFIVKGPTQICPWINKIFMCMFYHSDWRQALYISERLYSPKNDSLLRRRDLFSCKRGVKHINDRPAAGTEFKQMYTLQEV